MARPMPTPAVAYLSVAPKGAKAAKTPAKVVKAAPAKVINVSIGYGQLDASYLHETRPVTEPGALSAFPLL